MKNSKADRSQESKAFIACCKLLISLLVGAFMCSHGRPYITMSVNA